MRFLSTMVVVSSLAAHVGDARADGGDGIVQTKPRFWKSGPAGGAFGLFVEGGATAGCFVECAFGAGSLGLGVSLRWFEASFTGYYGSSFGTSDGPYTAFGFLGRAGLRVPVNHVAFSLGSELGALGGYPAFGSFQVGILRGALTVGYAMGKCSKR